MNEEQYNEMKEKIIEKSFYLTESIIEKDLRKADKMRLELNRLIDELLKNK